MTANALWALLAVALLGGCDKPAPPGPALAPDAAAAPSPKRHAPDPVAPQNPDYEDAPGVIEQLGSQWLIRVPNGAPICLPLEAPADLRKQGAKVRFTLYLSGQATSECRQVGMLVSMRSG